MANPNAKVYWRSIPGGTGTNGVTLTAKLMNGSPIASGVTAGAGNEAGKADINIGYPGPHYIEGTNSGTTLRSSSRDVGFIGTFSAADLPMIHQGEYTNGVLTGILNALAVSSDGVGLNVDVATGGFLINGHPFANAAITNLTVTANASGDPRIDTVVVRLTQIGQTLEGKIELAVVAGTPAGSPAAPALTQTSATWEEALADVAVANGASVPGAITDRRTFAGPTYVDASVISDDPTFTGSVTADGLVVNGTIVVSNSLVAQASATLGDADTDVIQIQGLLKTAGTSPTVTYGTGAGTGPSTGTLNGDGTSVRFIFTTGTAPAAAGANIFTLTFPTARADTNYGVWIQAVSRQAAIDNFYPFDSGRTTTTIGFAAEATLTASTEYRVDILIIGH